jgi:hypothetical protein
MLEVIRRVIDRDATETAHRALQNAAGHYVMRSSGVKPNEAYVKQERSQAAFAVARAPERLASQQVSKFIRVV